MGSVYLPWEDGSEEQGSIVSRRFWPFYVVIAWIATRDLHRFSEAHIETRSDAELIPWLRRHDLLPSHLREFWTALRASLAEGRIRGIGRSVTRWERDGKISRESYGSVEEISREDHARSQLVDGGGGDFFPLERVILPANSLVRIHGYDSLRLLRDDVLRQWPSDDTSIRFALRWSRPRKQPLRPRTVEKCVLFIEEQRQRREWINFGEIAEWGGDLIGSMTPDTAAIASAYEKLGRDLREGSFNDPNPKSRSWKGAVLAPPNGLAVKLTGRRASMIFAMYPHDAKGILAQCWIPRILFDTWLARHELPRAPSRFRPTLAAASKPPTARDEAAAIRFLAEELRVKGNQMTTAEALQRCRAQGFKISDDGFRNRIWPNARHEAGLPRKASPGRKKKSNP